MTKKDLTGRFGEDGDDDDDTPSAPPTRLADARPDPLARLEAPAPDEHEPPEESTWRKALDALRGRADLLAAACALLAAALVLWPQLRPTVVALPAVAERNTEIATLKVQPLVVNGVAAPPDWDGLFTAYQLETALRDISIRCNYGLPVDARTDSYLHARIALGTEINVFLADPGECPRR